MEILHRHQAGFSEYLSFLESKYGAQKNYIFFLDDVKKSLAFSSAFQDPYFILIKDGEKVLGHCALLLDPALNKDEAFFGFFDVVNDAFVFQKMWSELLRLAKEKGVKTLKGPINATAWHQYRAIRETDGSDFFKTELFSEPYHYHFLKDLNPAKEIRYHSGYRESFDFLIRATEPAYAKALDDGFAVEEVQSVTYADIEAVLEISKTVFRENWGYTNLTTESFVSLYSSQKLSAHLNKVYLLKKETAIIGYLSVLIEDSATLVFKTIAVLPEFRGIGLGNALVHKAHKDAAQAEYKKIVYALVREDNSIKNFPENDAVIFRGYSAFEFKIT